MHLDVTQLKAFYASALGRTVTSAICERLAGLLEPFRLARDHARAAMAADPGGDGVGNPQAPSPPPSRFRPLRWQPGPCHQPNIVALGYGVPYLEALQPDFDHALSFMPQAQGVLSWPAAAPRRASLVSETALPLPNACVDLLLGIHFLEMTDRPSAALREIWRVLRPEGTLLLIVPHRTGLWSRVEGTPFGHGRPYSMGQATHILSDALFEPVECGTILATPPFVARRWGRLALRLEGVGNTVWPALAGAVFIKARKRVHAPIGKLVPLRVPGFAPAGGLAAARMGHAAFAPRPHPSGGAAYVGNGLNAAPARAGTGPAS